MSYRRALFRRPAAGLCPWPAPLSLFLLLFGLLGGPAEARTLGFDEALRSALGANPELAAVARGPGIAEGERRQAALLPNPSLSWETEDTRRDRSTTTLSLTQPLELGGKRGARLAVAERGEAIAEMELEVRRNALRAEVLEAFQAAQQAQERLRLGEESVSLGQRALRAAEARVRAGKSAPLEATRAQVQLAEVELDLQRARIGRDQAYRVLAGLMGQAEPGFAEVTGNADLPAPPRAAQLLRRLDEAAELRLALLQVDQREAAVQLARAERVPNLDVSLGSQYDHEARERVNLVGLSLPLPLFDRNQGRLLAEARRADQARDLRNATELRLRRETQQALDLWGTARYEARTLRDTLLPAARQALDSATRGFEMGKFGFLEVLDAQRTLLAARDQYLQALARLAEARGRTERIFGDLAPR
ncbi:outer membrane protein, cobalt-zinc-cadmium efflux system [Pseudomonas delhiensis]|uniref:Outer membrane protein, cobalt-zinc-cadmium efflux system n=1 Tax=Pseudomonas delhiensis TaxID=366289 RepID=A0A239GY21_9PSED|nr:TolC family protein [Pseudomonas delhiensis]SDI80688.1 outer membrane protein, cobalt-zinc-cadmium efflux system [Pseudomonas delhiensis]SNS73812.1 outer membrane protein, cobalt-zinc-cadmium efflux system [Pseudomonas delhiensis]